ncbi:S8 family serine peptidase [Halobacteriovorax sp. HLS]|uniref:S8 family serine peptidase n=1 Tax=Halobacteriovorax sp. HLS TaxID=2234000 RepID=UPI0013E36A03|nr:S8 family serine peptidase [Halobacteriovorax sp. HLS]
MKNSIISFLILLSSNCFALSAAILDNGIDYSHRDLQSRVSINFSERENNSDDDRNGYIDDIRGWNFIDMNNEVFDFKRDLEISDDIKLYYELKAKKSLGTITDEESKTYSLLLKDQDLKKRRKELTSWIHGTHVGAIAINTHYLPKELRASDIKVLPVVYLGKAVKGVAKSPDFSPIQTNSLSKKKLHIKKYWQKYHSWQINKLSLAVDYAHKKVIVYNGSFGQSFSGATEMIANVYKEQFKKEMKKEEATKEARLFMSKLNASAKKLFHKYPNNLFIFSAGNKKLNTDEYLHFPSGANASNSISVGASYKRNTMAYFSNYGKNSVDLFAPGVAISSAVPYQEYLKINGTSQAAPFVTNISLIAFSLAQKLKVSLGPTQLRRILLETVDKREDLKDKSRSSGVIYPERVFDTIRNMKRHSLTNSINKAIRKWPSIPLDKEVQSYEEALFIDLPSN